MGRAPQRSAAALRESGIRRGCGGARPNDRRTHSRDCGRANRSSARWPHGAHDRPSSRRSFPGRPTRSDCLAPSACFRRWASPGLARPRSPRCRGRQVAIPFYRGLDLMLSTRTTKRMSNSALLLTSHQSSRRPGCPGRLSQNRTSAVHIRLFGTAVITPPPAG